MSITAPRMCFDAPEFLHYSASAVTQENSYRFQTFTGQLAKEVIEGVFMSSLCEEARQMGLLQDNDEPNIQMASSYGASCTRPLSVDASV